MLHPFLSTRKSNLEGKIEIASAHWPLLKPNSFSRSKTDITSLQLQRLWSRAGQMVREKYKFCAFMQRISSRGNVWRTVGRRRWRPESKNPPGSTSLAAQNQVSYLDFWNDCWCLSDAAAVDLLEGQQDYWSYDNNRYTQHCIAMQCIPSTHNLTPFWIQSCCAFHFSYLTLSHMTLSTIWPSPILVHPSTFLSCFHLVQASVLPRTRSNAGPLNIASLPFPPASLFTNITPEIKVMSSDSNMGQDVFLFHDARQMCVLPQMGAGFVANFLI